MEKRQGTGVKFCLMERESPPREDVISRRDSLSGRVLNDCEVIDLVFQGDINEIETITKWLGCGIERQDIPAVRFGDILDRSWESFTEAEKGLVLQRGFNLVLGDFTYKYGYTCPEMIGNWEYEKIQYEYIGYFPTIAESARNLGSLLEKVLDLGKDDLAAAKGFIRGIRLEKKTSASSVLLHAFYTPFSQNLSEDEPYSIDMEIVKRFGEINPKIPLLAFHAEDHLGLLNHLNRFHMLLRTEFSKFDGVMKTLVMGFVKDQVIEGRIDKRRLRIVEDFMRENAQLYEQVRKHYPNSPFVRDFRITSAAINLDELLEKTKVGRLSVEELLSLVDAHPDLLELVTSEELESALNVTKDHGVSLRIERLLRRKR